jgi:hypothetical protein
LLNDKAGTSKEQMKKMTLAGTVAIVIISLAGWASPAFQSSQQNPPQPPAASESAVPAATPEPTPSSQSATPAKKAGARKTARRHKRSTTNSGQATKKVVRNGGTQEPMVQIAPGMSDDQASKNRQGTAQLLATTDANLKKLDGQRLDGSKQDVVKQIQTYVEQARTAEAAGDLDRAHNLAVKAQLLSDDLVRH